MNNIANESYMFLRFITWIRDSVPDPILLIPVRAWRAIIPEVPLAAGNISRMDIGGSGTESRTQYRKCAHRKVKKTKIKLDSSAIYRSNAQEESLIASKHTSRIHEKDPAIIHSRKHCTLGSGTESRTQYRKCAHRQVKKTKIKLNSLAIFPIRGLSPHFRRLIF